MTIRQSCHRTTRAAMLAALGVPAAAVSAGAPAVAATPAAGQSLHMRYLRVFDIDGGIDNNTCAEI